MSSFGEACDAKIASGVVKGWKKNRKSTSRAKIRVNKPLDHDVAETPMQTNKAAQSTNGNEVDTFFQKVSYKAKPTSLDQSIGERKDLAAFLEGKLSIEQQLSGRSIVWTATILSLIPKKVQLFETFEKMYVLLFNIASSTLVLNMIDRTISYKNKHVLSLDNSKLGNQILEYAAFRANTDNEFHLGDTAADMTILKMYACRARI